VNPVELSITIARPREEVFEYLADIANHPEFTDHFLTQWHLTREQSYGRGAGARFMVTAPLQRFNWADVTLSEVESPRRIVELGRTGKFNRIRLFAEYVLDPAPGGGTRVSFRTETDPSLPTDRLMESFGLRRWVRRNYTRALRRLRAILEDGEQRGERATVAPG
jgi:uncharacterized protein YndB with AHSA1/START domain